MSEREAVCIFSIIGRLLACVCVCVSEGPGGGVVLTIVSNQLFTQKPLWGGLRGKGGGEGTCHLISGSVLPLLAFIQINHAGVSLRP